MALPVAPLGLYFFLEMCIYIPIVTAGIQEVFRGVLGFTSFNSTYALN